MIHIYLTTLSKYQCVFAIELMRPQWRKVQNTKEVKDFQNNFNQSISKNQLIMSQNSNLSVNPWLFLYLGEVNEALRNNENMKDELLDTEVPKTEISEADKKENDVITIDSESESNDIVEEIPEEINEPPTKKIKEEKDTSVLSQSFLTQVVVAPVETKLDAEFEFENLIQMSEQEVSEFCIKTGKTVSEKSLTNLLQSLSRSDIENPYMHLINKHVLMPKFLSSSQTSRNFEMALRKYVERFPLIAIETFFVPVISSQDFTKTQCDMFILWIQDSYTQNQKTDLFRKLLQHNTFFQNTSIMYIIHMLLTKTPTCLESHENEIIMKISDSPTLPEEDVIFGKLILLITQRVVSIDEISKQKLQFLIQSISKVFIKKSAQKAFDKLS